MSKDIRRIFFFYVISLPVMDRINVLAVIVAGNNKELRLKRQSKSDNFNHLCITAGQTFTKVFY